MAALPYVTAPGNIDRALRGIKAAATPTNVSQDFVKTILKIPGGSGNQMTSYLRKIGFVNADGTPSDVYKTFRNPATEGRAVAQALKIAYQPLYTRNEFMHELNEAELKGLIIEETGEGQDSNIVPMIANCIKILKKYAKWSGGEERETSTPVAQVEKLPTPQPMHEIRSGLRMNLGYTINLNLPATSDVAVFNAIFKSLKENLLKDTNE